MNFEFTHDSLARAVFDKVSAEEKTRRKVERFVKDRYVYYLSQKVLLSQKDIDYVLPYLADISIKDEEKAFIKRSISNSRKRRFQILGGIIAALIISFLAILANSERIKAEASRQSADSNRQVAEYNAALAENERTKADSSATVAQRRATEASIAREEAEVQRGRAQRAAETASRLRGVAEAAAKDLLISNDSLAILFGEAKAARLQEEKERALADSLRKVAEVRTVIAVQQTNLSLAQSLAFKSMEIEDRNQRALIAQEAYLIHEAYGGEKLNPAIYRAIESALFIPFPSKSVHKGPVRDLEPFPDSDIIMTAGSDGWVNQFSLTQGKELRFQEFQVKPRLSLGNIVRSIVVVNSELWIGTEDGFISRLTPHSESETIIGRIHRGPVWSMAATDSSIYSTGADGNLIQVAISDGTRDTLLSGRPRLMKVEADQSNKWLFVLDENGEIIILELSSGKSLMSFRSQSNFTAMAISPDNSKLVTGDAEGVLRIFSITGDLLHSFVAHQGRISSVAFDPSGKLLASGGWDRRVQIREMSRINELPISLDNHSGRITDLLFTAGNNVLLVGLSNGIVTGWQTNQPELYLQLAEQNGPLWDSVQVDWDIYLEGNALINPNM